MKTLNLSVKQFFLQELQEFIKLKLSLKMVCVLLQCTYCGKKYPVDEKVQRCDCGEPLELEIQQGEFKKGETPWERFRDFYPFDFDLDFSLGEGNTPLSKMPKLSKELDVELFIKNETTNPTWSFKDRGTFIGIHRAIKLGFDEVGTVSSGNMAESVATFGKRFGLDTLIFVGADLITEEKIAPIAVHDPRLIKVFGDYGELYFKTLELGKEKNIYFINSDVPFRIEGYKTISFEIVEKMLPDYVFIPTSSGGLFRGVTKGFVELKKNEIIEKMPTLVAVQAEGCSPTFKAFKEGKNRIEHFGSTDTVAHGISNPYPPSGNDVLRKVREYGGLVMAVNDEEILKAQRDMAKDGIFAQPAGCVGVAALRNLQKDNRVKDNAKVVALATGAGFKFLSGVKGVKEAETIKLEDIKKVF